MRFSLRSTGFVATLAVLAACNSDGTLAPDNSPVSVSAVQADVQSVSAASASDAVAAIGTGLSSAGVSYYVAPANAMGLSVAAGTVSGSCSFSQATGFYTCTGGKEHGLLVTRQFKIFSGGVGTPTTGLADSTLAIWTTSGRDTSSEDSRVRIRIVNHADTNMSVITRDTAAPHLPTKFTNNGHGTQQDTVIFSDSNGVKTYTISNDVRVTNLVRKAPEPQNPFPASGTITITLAGSMKYAPKTGETVTKSVAGTAVVTFNGTQNASLALGGKTCSLDLVTRKVSNCQ
ncbi:MAG: hypothetical protein HY275_11000 [Gemmatimonadetes bacterium]|nr:hypothetical protein [Gemmatimonadota bacterium]